MFVWFIAVSVTVVALIFRSPDLDYRLVMLGSVLPLVEGAFGAGGYYTASPSTPSCSSG